MARLGKLSTPRVDMRTEWHTQTNVLLPEVSTDCMESESGYRYDSDPTAFLSRMDKSSEQGGATRNPSFPALITRPWTIPSGRGGWPVRTRACACVSVLHSPPVP